MLIETLAQPIPAADSIPCCQVVRLWMAVNMCQPSSWRLHLFTTGCCDFANSNDFRPWTGESGVEKVQARLLQVENK